MPYSVKKGLHEYFGLAIRWWHTALFERVVYFLISFAYYATDMEASEEVDIFNEGEITVFRNNIKCYFLE